MAKMGQIRMAERTIVAKCRIANDPFSRFLGLMGKTTVPTGEGVLFPNCNSIHTFFMRMPIDVIFIDNNGKVQEVLARLPAWRMLWPRLKAKHTLELGAGHAEGYGIREGTQLNCEGIF